MDSLQEIQFLLFGFGDFCQVRQCKEGGGGGRGGWGGGPVVHAVPCLIYILPCLRLVFSCLAKVKQLKVYGHDPDVGEDWKGRNPVCSIAWRYTHKRTSPISNAKKQHKTQHRKKIPCLLNIKMIPIGTPLEASSHVLKPMACFVNVLGELFIHE